jgi:hypothetical protein
MQKCRMVWLFFAVVSVWFWAFIRLISGVKDLFLVYVYGFNMVFILAALPPIGGRKKPA